MHGIILHRVYKTSVQTNGHGPSLSMLVSQVSTPKTNLVGMKRYREHVTVLQAFEDASHCPLILVLVL